MTTQNGDTLPGFFFALAAYVMWGFLPFYMKLVSHISPFEVVAHRAAWSVPIAGAVLIWLGRTSDLRAALTNPRMLKMAAVTAGLISLNWGVYVWAIGSGRALETALGYYINPLFSMFLGAVLLKERLTRAQLVAIMLAVCAVLLLTYEAGGLPWVSISLAVSFGFYGYFRKTLPVGPNQGFLLEVLIIAPFALVGIIWLEATGEGHFVQSGWRDTLLLLAAGVVTALPLIAYGNGAKLLKLSTIAIMQYIAPTMIFLIAIFVFREPFSAMRLVAFGLIWAALIVYTWSMVSQARKNRAHAETGPIAGQ